MTVEELIAELETKPPDAIVVLYLSGSEDAEECRAVDEPIITDGLGNPDEYYCKGDHPSCQNERYDGAEVVHITS